MTIKLSVGIAYAVNYGKKIGRSGPRFSGRRNPPQVCNHPGPEAEKVLTQTNKKRKEKEMESTLKLKPSVKEQINVLCTVASVSQVLGALARVATEKSRHIEDDVAFMDFLGRVVDSYRTAKNMKI